MNLSTVDDHLDALETRANMLLARLRASRTPLHDRYINTLRHLLGALEPLPKCGKQVGRVSKALGTVRICVMPDGHTAACSPGGSCLSHGPYIGLDCPERAMTSCLNLPATSHVSAQQTTKPRRDDETLLDGYPSLDSDDRPVCEVCGVSIPEIGLRERHQRERANIKV